MGLAWTNKEIMKKVIEKRVFVQALELAFLCENSSDVDKPFKKLISMGATSIQEPQDMSCNQRTALFTDTDGNIHEIFAEIK